MNENVKIIKEIEACIPEEKAGIAKSRSALVEVNQKREEDKENNLIVLRRQEDKLLVGMALGRAWWPASICPIEGLVNVLNKVQCHQAEIESLKMDLASKESLLASVVQDIEKTKNVEDDSFKGGMAQLKNREMLLSKEEQRLEVMRSKRDAVAKKCEQSKESSAKLQKQHEEQVGFFSACILVSKLNVLCGTLLLLHLVDLLLRCQAVESAVCLRNF